MVVLAASCWNCVSYRLYQPAGNGCSIAVAEWTRAKRNLTVHRFLRILNGKVMLEQCLPWGWARHWPSWNQSRIVSELGYTGRAGLAGHDWGIMAPSHGSVQSQHFQHYITHVRLLGQWLQKLHMSLFSIYLMVESQVRVSNVLNQNHCHSLKAISRPLLYISHCHKHFSHSNIFSTLVERRIWLANSSAVVFCR